MIPHTPIKQMEAQLRHINETLQSLTNSRTVCQAFFGQAKRASAQYEQTVLGNTLKNIRREMNRLRANRTRIMRQLALAQMA